MKILDLLESKDNQALLLGIYYLSQTDFLTYVAYSTLSQGQKYNFARILCDPSIISYIRIIDNNVLLVIKDSASKDYFGIFLETFIKLYKDYENQ